jgi:hypothetical protein
MKMRPREWPARHVGEQGGRQAFEDHVGGIGEAGQRWQARRRTECGKRLARLGLVAHRDGGQR